MFNLNPFRSFSISVFWVASALLVAPAVSSGAGDFCFRPDLEKQAILAEGRVMPLGLHASKVRTNLFKKGSCDSIPAEMLYCLLSTGGLAAVEAHPGCRPLFKAEHQDTFTALGLPGRSSDIPVELALANQDRFADLYHELEQAGKGSSGFGTDLAGVLNRIDQYQAIVGGSDWLVLNAEGQWTKISEIQAAGDPGAVERNVMASLERVSTSERQGMQIETLYEKTHPFSVAILLGLLSFVASLAVGRFPRAGRFALALIGLTLLVEGYGIVLRVLISGRAPVTNMFETVMWVGLCALGLSALLGTKLKNAQVWSVGIAVNLVALFMMLFATRMLDGGIQPLVPVLRDNFWLSTHVTTITTSYACFAFAWLLSNAVLVRQILGYLSEEGLERWNYVARITIQIGTVFLAAGIILGGVWADYSWGRFWGWDPKETWSLIALIVHTGILHGRYTGWFKGIQFTRMAALGFLSIIMAWFGVNYILAVGLHSYGFSSGGAAMIAAVVGVQSVILAISWLRTRRTVLA